MLSGLTSLLAWPGGAAVVAAVLSGGLVLGFGLLLRRARHRTRLSLAPPNGGPPVAGVKDWRRALSSSDRPAADMIAEIETNWR